MRKGCTQCARAARAGFCDARFLYGASFCDARELCGLVAGARIVCSRGRRHAFDYGFDYVFLCALVFDSGKTLIGSTISIGQKTCVESTDSIEPKGLGFRV